MKLIVEGKSYEYDNNSFKVSEGILLEQLTGMTFMQWQEGLGEMRPLALKGLVYLARVRAAEPTDWLTLDFDMTRIDFEDDEPVVPAVPLEAEPVSGSATSGTGTSAS